MTMTIARLLAGAGLAWSMSMPAVAIPVRCGPHGMVTAMLAQQYQEKREAIGLSSAGQLMEVFVSQSGTWTVLLTSPAGIACVVGAGDYFERIVTPPPQA